MAVLEVNLPDTLNVLLAKHLESGRYSNSDEVIQAGLYALAYEETQRAKLADLQAAIEEGLASGLAEEDVMDRLRDELVLELGPYEVD